jgi:hypothetical protein
MRCHICNTRLESNEIKRNKDTNKYEPCRTCIEISERTYSSDFEEDTLHTVDAEDFFNSRAEKETGHVKVWI